MTALHWAAHWNDIPVAKRLVAAGAKAAAANRYGVTPLHEAATAGSPEMIALLLEAGADPNAKYGEGETPLMSAARTGNVRSVRLLLTAGADVNAAEAWRGQTALMWAAVENHAEVARVLVEAGAAVDARTVTLEFQRLTGGAGGIIHDRPQGGLTALMFAARQGALDVTRVLLDARADANAAEPQYGFTAMQTAIFNGHYSLAALLMERGADVNDGSLYVAVEMRNLAHYTNRPNPPDSDGRFSHLDVIRMLLEKGADPNRAYTKRIPPRQAQGNINVPPGATPLYRAVRSIDLQTVRALLDHGANPSMPVKDGSTPLMAAAGLGAPRADDEEVTEAGDRADPVDVIALLVEKGADVHAANNVGNTALHYAVQRGSAPVIQALVSRGGKLDVKNKRGQTPADLARGPAASLVKTMMSQGN
jgi:ankyrin repeat protein